MEKRKLQKLRNKRNLSMISGQQFGKEVRNKKKQMRRSSLKIKKRLSVT